MLYEQTKRFEANMSLVPFVMNRRFYGYYKYEEDLLQEGYLALWRCCLNYDESRNIQFTTYAVTSIFHQMLNYVQRTIHKHIGVMSLEDVIADNHEGSELLLIETLSSPESFTKYGIEECLKKLSGKEQQIIQGIMVGYNQNEIADDLGVSQATVSRCLKKFKNLYKEERSDV